MSAEAAPITKLPVSDRLVRRIVRIREVKPGELNTDNDLIGRDFEAEGSVSEDVVQAGPGHGMNGYRQLYRGRMGLKEHLVGSEGQEVTETAMYLTVRYRHGQNFYVHTFEKATSDPSQFWSTLEDDEVYKQELTDSMERALGYSRGRS